MLAQFPRFASFQIQLKTGWTASKLQPQSPEIFTPSQLRYQAANFKTLHRPFAGITLECEYRRLFLETGLSYMTLGARQSPIGAEAWSIHYVVIPFLFGYRSFTSKHTQLIIEGGTEVALQVAETPAYGHGGVGWGSLHLVIGLQARWKAFSFGTRLQIGVTKFRYLQTTTLRHAGWTTYVGYVIKGTRKKRTKISKKEEW
ncbi:MAG: hypothetical protein ACRBFS_11555 [Aureispira sp.]